MLSKLQSRLFVLIILSNFNLVNFTLAQTTSSGGTPPRMRPTFFEEERKPKPNGFRETFLFDSLNGTSDPLSGTGSSTSAVNRPIPNFSDSFLLNSFEPAPADFNLSGVNGKSFSSRGELSINGSFTTLVPQTEFSPATSITFNTGTTNFIINQPIDVKSPLINFGFNDPALSALLGSQGYTRENVETNLTNATVTPSALPRGPVFSGRNGGFIIGPVPDR